MQSASFRTFCLGLGALIAMRAVPAETYYYYQATGPTRESIEPAINQFRHDIIYGRGGSEQNPPPFLGFYRLANFEDVATEHTLSAPMLVSGGLEFRGAFPQLLVSSSDSGPGATNRLFGDLGEKYPDWLAPYSGSSLLTLAAREGDSSGVISVAPAGVTLTQTQVNAFGAVFVDVDDASSVSLSWLFPTGSHIVSIPTSPGDHQFSFLGVLMEGNEFPFAATFRVDLPGLPIALPLATEDAAHDVVGIDDVIIGTAPPIPEPSTAVLLLAGLLLTGQRWCRRFSATTAR